MQSKEYFSIAYGLLSRIYREGEYSNILVNSLKDDEKAVMSLVYGVLERHFELLYTVRALCDKMPKKAEELVLFIGIYSVKYLKKPDYAVINECVELTNSLGKKGASGFINAVLKKFASGEYDLKLSKNEKEEIEYNLPYWLIGMIKKQEPTEYKRILAQKTNGRTHVRTIKGVTLNGEKTLTGYFVTPDKSLDELIFNGKATYMSYASSLVAYSVRNEIAGKRVLDYCAAPGGKSVQLCEEGGAVTACDIYPHRLDLIRAYAKRMKVKLDVRLNDGTVHYPSFVDAFDVVLVDAPCSGFGSVDRRKDLILRKTYDDIMELAALQKKLLDTARAYVKSGGILLYSTCTILNKENKDVIEAFVSENPDFTLEKIDLPYANEGMLQLYPDDRGTEGFFICRMRKR